MNIMRVRLRFYLPDFIENLNTNIEELEKIYDKNITRKVTHFIGR